jgi:hypothetical protein
MGPIKAINRYDVQVVLPEGKVRIMHTPGVVLTPEQVLTALEAFCARVREAIAGQVPPPPAPPAELDPGTS